MSNDPALDALSDADRTAQLTLLAAMLGDRDIDTDLVAAGDQVPITTLLVHLGADDLDRDRTMAITIMPFDEDDLASTQLTQFYTVMPFDVAEPDMALVQRAAAIVNGALAIGSFGVNGDQIFYRHVLATPSDVTFDLDMTYELFALLTFHQEHFGDYIEGVASGDILLESLPQLLTS